MNWTAILIIIVCLSSAYIGYVGLTLIRMMERLEKRLKSLEDKVWKWKSEYEFRMNLIGSSRLPEYGEISVDENSAVIMNLETLHSLCQDDSPLRKQIRDKPQVEYVIAKGIRERGDEWKSE